MKYLLANGLLLFLLSGCTKEDVKTRCNDFDLQQTTIVNTEDYQVWSDILPHKGGAPFIIQQKTWKLDSSTVYWLKNDSLSVGFKVDSALLASYIEINKTEEYWGSFFTVPSQLIARSEIECLIQPGNINGWEGYYDKYPKGFWNISRVGINGDAALVNYSYYCNNLCGESAFLLLRRVNGIWVIERQGATLVS